MKVLVNGVGNIGTTLLNLLVEFRELLEIDEIYAHKNLPQEWGAADLEILKNKGVKFCFSHPAFSSERQYSAVLSDVDYVFECRESGLGLAAKEEYLSHPNVRGVSAQGSEKNFGTPFMAGVNESQILSEKFVQIVSCNTHGTAAILKLFGGDDLNNLVSADIVCVRRSEDISHHKRLTGANVIARHLDPGHGTHHGVDVFDLYETLGLSPNLVTSDITTPSQLLHSIRFNLQLRKPVSLSEKLSQSSCLAATQKFDTAQVFELGRRYGFQGRLFSHAILVTNNLLINDNVVRGWAMVPQEGNTLISTLAAFLWQTEASSREEKLEAITARLNLSEI